MQNYVCNHILYLVAMSVTLIAKFHKSYAKREFNVLFTSVEINLHRVKNAYDNMSKML